MYIVTIRWNWEDMPTLMEAYKETLGEALKAVDDIFKERLTSSARSIEIFETEGKHNHPRKLIASMRTIK